MRNTTTRRGLGDGRTPACLARARETAGATFYKVRRADGRVVTVSVPKR